MLRDGDTFDLGARTLRVIHTPGSPESIWLLDERDAYYSPATLFFALLSAFFALPLAWSR